MAGKHIVVSHAHHPDEKVYRIVIARVAERVEMTEVPNPLYDEEEAQKLVNPPVLTDEDIAMNGHRAMPDIDYDKIRPTITMQRTVKELVDHSDIVWHSEDERWQGREPEDIAAEQRQEISKLLHELAEEEAQVPNIVDLGGAGTEL
jgi:hypothetical protein